MNKKQYVKMYIEGLRALSERTDEGPGICDALPNEVAVSKSCVGAMIGSEIVEALSPHWPLFSGKTVFPVPGQRDMTGGEFDLEYSTITAYSHGDNWAETEYGDLRREFTDWMADELERMV